jgi:hypothetical protein
MPVETEEQLVKYLTDVHSIEEQAAQLRRSRTRRFASETGLSLVNGSSSS